MAVKYEIKTIKNASGAGNARTYVHLQTDGAMTERELTAAVEKACTLTESDVLAVLTALRTLAVRELSEGRRFCVPGLGYISLSAGLDDEAAESGKAVRGTDIHLRGLNFRPERQLVNTLASRVRFERARPASASTTYTDEALWEQLSPYLDEHHTITVRRLQSVFDVARAAAYAHIAAYVADGRLVNAGTPRMPVYLKP